MNEYLRDNDDDDDDDDLTMLYFLLMISEAKLLILFMTDATLSYFFLAQKIIPLIIVRQHRFCYPIENLSSFCVFTRSDKEASSLCSDDSLY